jgi:cystathionine beta-lyase
MAVFEKHGVYVISDEIWADLTFGEHRHIPTQSVSDYAKEHTVALYAPSKTFNLAGLIGSYSIVYNPYLRERINKSASLSHYNHMNVLSMHALIGAYTSEGEEWLGELREVLSRNVRYTCDFIKENLDGVEVSEPEGTYIMFLDATKWCEDHGVSIDEVLRRGVAAGVIWQDGRCFGGSCHARINIALPLPMLKEALDRLKKYVFV